MKKIRFFLMMAVVGVVAVSCMKNDVPETPPYQKYVDWYSIISKQNTVALEPFKVAYKLNQYIDGVTKNPGDESVIRKNLFGNATIAKDGNTYTIEYSMSSAISGEFYRGGTVKIYTGGKILSDVGSSWSVETLTDTYFSIYSGSFTLDQLIGNYYISVMDDYVWEVSASDIYQIMYENPYYWARWSINYTIEQTEGTALYADRNFEATFEYNAYNTGSSLIGGRFSYETLSPLLFSNTNGCSLGAISGGIERLILRDEYSYPTDTVTFDYGTILKKNPACTMTYKIDGVEQTKVFEY